MNYRVNDPSLDIPLITRGIEVTKNVRPAGQRGHMRLADLKANKCTFKSAQNSLCTEFQITKYAARHTINVALNPLLAAKVLAGDMTIGQAHYQLLDTQVTGRIPRKSVYVAKGRGKASKNGKSTAPYRRFSILKRGNPELTLHSIWEEAATSKVTADTAERIIINMTSKWKTPHLRQSEFRHGVPEAIYQQVGTLFTGLGLKQRKVRMFGSDDTPNL